MTATKFGLAQPVRRVEDPRLLKGNGRYTDDIALPGMLVGLVVRSPHAAAKILSLDVAAAQAVPGVHAVYTAVDLAADKIGGLPCAAPVQNKDGTDMVAPPHPVLADGMVRHVGDPIAFVVADTMQAARDAAERIAADYDMLASSTDLAATTNADAALVWPQAPGNICFDWDIGDKAATDAAFAQAAHVTRLTIVNNRIVVSSIEARAAVAAYDAASGRWTLHANTQGGWLVKNLIGPVFGVDPEQFRVITPDVGGGFGMKLFLYAEHVLTCYAAQKLGRPVKWAADRSEALAVGDADIGEEDFVEVGRAGDLFDRARLDSGGFHVEEEEGQAVMFRLIGIGPGDDDAEIREMGARGPDFLPVDNPVIAIAFSAGAQAGDV